MTRGFTPGTVVPLILSTNMWPRTVGTGNITKSLEQEMKDLFVQTDILMWKGTSTILPLPPRHTKTLFSYPPCAVIVVNIGSRLRSAPCVNQLSIE